MIVQPIHQKLWNYKLIMRFFKHPLAIVESEDIGEGTRIWAWTHVMKGARIGKYCNIGEHCYIESKVVIGDFCTIKNQVALWDGIYLEDFVFVGPNAVFTNDKYPRSRNENWELKQTVVRRYATVGAGAIILCGVEIGRYAMVAAGAVVTKSVPDFSIVAGNPGKIVGYVCACGLPLKKSECRRCGRKYNINRKTKRVEFVGGPPLT